VIATVILIVKEVLSAFKETRNRQYQVALEVNMTGVRRITVLVKLLKIRNLEIEQIHLGSNCLLNGVRTSLWGDAKATVIAITTVKGTSNATKGMEASQYHLV